MTGNPAEKFRELVFLKYHLYNSLFIVLPYSGLSDIGIKLPLFTELCQKELEKGRTPQEIIEFFFKDVLHIDNREDQIKVIFLFLQMVERQVVLFDALEDAAFTSIQDLSGPGTLENFLNNVKSFGLAEKMAKTLETYRIRITLTAHPTQFYPETILLLINDLYEALKTNNLFEIDKLLLQLGKTPFRNTEKVSSLSEAINLINRSEKIFYETMLNFHETLFKEIYSGIPNNVSPVIELGFWPGGDRDGNPNVRVDTTLKIAESLKSHILHHYLEEVDKLRHRLTFIGVDPFLNHIELKLHSTLNHPKKGYDSPEHLLQDLSELKQFIKDKHQSLFIELIDRLILAVGIFKFHFGILDIRQDSQIHSEALEAIFNKISHTLPAECQNYVQLDPDAKFILLQSLLQSPAQNVTFKLDDPTFQDVLDVFQIIPVIQENNGERGLHRYIISNATESYHVLEVILLAYWSNLPLSQLQLDIVPLFESIESLKGAVKIMDPLYSLPLYREHLKRRKNIQTIMLGFSDGTKDGGYLTCNWEVFKCKQALTKVCRSNGLDVIFFDGRGGPPSRGGGKSHEFYRAISTQLPQREIQLTIQGQTISSNFGIEAKAKYNLEQLFSSGLEGFFHAGEENNLDEQDCRLLDKLSQLSFQKYLALKNHPSFIPYLEKITPLKYYGRLNISSRPMKRKQNAPLNLKDLRAISFVGTWAQMKQNIPGYFGVGTALNTLIEEGYEKELQKLYKNRLFFRALIDNSMQSLSKSFLPLTRYLSEDPEFGEFWQIIQAETELSMEKIKQITCSAKLLDNDPNKCQSISLREEMLLPILVIQQYALMMIRQNPPEEEAKIYEKMIIKSISPIINASRNSA